MPNATRRPDPRRELDDGGDAPIRRASRKRGWWTPLRIGLACGGGAALAALLVVAAVAVRGRTPGGSDTGNGSAARTPAAEVEGVSWDCHQLVAYLNSRGLAVKGEGPFDEIRGAMAQLKIPDAHQPPDKAHDQLAHCMVLSSAGRNGVVICLGGSGDQRPEMGGVEHGTLQMSWGGFWFEDQSAGEGLIRAIHAELPGSRLIRGPLRR